MFPKGRQLPALQALCLDVPRARLDKRDLQQLVLCCPNLQHLTLFSAVQLDVPLLFLLQLTQLRALHLQDDACDDKLASVLCQLTKLTQLNLQTDPGQGPLAGMSVSALLQLTRLTQLVELQLVQDHHSCHESSDDDDDDGGEGTTTGSVDDAAMKRVFVGRVELYSQVRQGLGLHAPCRPLHTWVSSSAAH